MKVGTRPCRFVCAAVPPNTSRFLCDRVLHRCYIPARAHDNSYWSACAHVPCAPMFLHLHAPACELFFSTIPACLRAPLYLTVATCPCASQILHAYVPPVLRGSCCSWCESLGEIPSEFLGEFLGELLKGFLFEFPGKIVW